MKITRLIEQHRKFEDQGLPDNFGDGYLMANNRFFQKIRAAALKMSYRFSTDRNDAYETFPLLQLESVLNKKVLPYSNNISAFKQMSPAQLDVLSWEDADGNLKKNFVFHEASHAVARSLANQILGPQKKIGDLASQRTFALRMLIEESCANTVELFGAVDVHDQIHRVFFEMNSYMNNFENRTHLKNAMAEIGDAILIKFMILAYLQANFLRDKIEDRQFQEMVRIATNNAPLDPKKLKTLRAVAKVAFQLSERFRVQTTSFHLRLAGIKVPVDKLFDYDFLPALKNDSFKKFIIEFAAQFA